MDRQQLKLLLYIMILISLVVGCDREGENIPTGAVTVDMYLTDAWSAYESSNFETAITAFNNAKQRDAVKQDVYNGLGWSYAQIADYENSISNFKLLLSLTDDDALITDCYAGLAMTYSSYRELPVEEGNPDTMAIEYATQALEMDPNYQFSHDPNVNEKSLHVLIAQSHFNSQEFLHALNEIEMNIQAGFRQELLNDGTVVNVSGDSIEVNVSASTPFNGIAALVIDSKSLVDILSINRSIMEPDSTVHAISYHVVDFVQGGQDISFTGIPVPKEEEIYLVDYLHAPSYGIFLSRVLATIEENQP